MPAFSERENEVLQIAVRILRERLDPRRIILFGSRATGTHRLQSDFDLAVDAPVPDRFVRSGIDDVIDVSVGLYQVDVVYLDSVEPAFRDHIVKTGKTVYERQEKRSAA